jgi:predicted metalloprotease
MQWRGRRQSDNVVDNRGMRRAGMVGGAGIIIAIIYALLGGDPSVLIDDGGQSTTPTSGQTAADNDQKEFVGVVLADTEDVWTKLFADHGLRYEPPRLVLFDGRTRSACGTATSAVGPFYCPADGQVYLDLAFFADLQDRLGAGGDFARAYVVAHEIGHHVQALLGVTGERDDDTWLQRRRDTNAASVRVELQADCLAGVWANVIGRTKNVLEQGDVDEAMTAAAAVGDDRLQQEAQGYVVPDSFTHGTSAQRSAAFARGYAQGRIEDCGIQAEAL